MSRFWLFKSDPESFSFDDLLRAPGRTTSWDGVRNPEARNFLRDGVAAGDRVLVHHTGAPHAAIVGIAQVARAGYPDATAFAPDDPHFDPKSERTRPTWYTVDLRAVERLARPVPLAEIKAHPTLRHMGLVTRGRLSIQPVTAGQWKAVLALAERPEPATDGGRKGRSRAAAAGARAGRARARRVGG